MQNLTLQMDLRKTETALVEERSARMKAEQSLQSSNERLMDAEDRLKRVEGIAIETLIHHTIILFDI